MMIRKSENNLHMMKRLIKQLGWIDIYSQGTSMFPFIREGDLCRFFPCEEDGCSSYRRGDVLLFMDQEGRLIGHRLHRIEYTAVGRRFLLKGDTNVHHDGWLESERILGKLVWIRRGRRTTRVNSPVISLWSWLMVQFPFHSWVIRKAIHSKRRRNGKEGSSYKY